MSAVPMEKIMMPFAHKANQVEIFYAVTIMGIAEDRSIS